MATTSGSTLNKVTQLILPKKKANEKGVAYTNTYNPTATTTVLSAPNYRNHLTDLFTSRQQSDSRVLMKDLAKFDPDVSATIHAFLTVANTTPRFYVYDENDVLDQVGQQTLHQLLGALNRRSDYSTNFDFTKSFREISEEFRYMVLLRGACHAELVFNKLLLPASIRIVDPVTVEWFETAPGVYKPQQRPAGSSTPISLDIPNFFVKNYRQNPTEIYAESMFVSAINTVAARQQVINDLYRIMQKTGYPRIDISVAEEVLRKNLPSNIKANDSQATVWVNARLSEIAAQVSDLGPEDAFVHVDAVETEVVNQGGPGKSMDVTSVIEVLNAQNQAALKTMATIIGRGTSGVNTASVEARIFSMSADSLNGPIADMFSDMLTLAIRLTGYLGYVVVKFDEVELRPQSELEPQFIMRQTRLQNDLSLGLITDDEYHIQMYGRPRPDSAPLLSGTGFMMAAPGGAAGSASVDASKISPNSDPLGRSITTPGSKSAKSATVNKKPGK